VRDLFILVGADDYRVSIRLEEGEPVWLATFFTYHAAMRFAKLVEGAKAHPLDPFESERFQKTEELARAASALQELRYLAWTALKVWDSKSRIGMTSSMEAMRAVLPTETPA
jgi:hypothetical protein